MYMSKIECKALGNRENYLFNTTLSNSYNLKQKKSDILKIQTHMYTFHYILTFSLGYSGKIYSFQIK